MRRESKRSWDRAEDMYQSETSRSAMTTLIATGRACSVLTRSPLHLPPTTSSLPLSNRSPAISTPAGDKHKGRGGPQRTARQGRKALAPADSSTTRQQRIQGAAGGHWRGAMEVGDQPTSTTVTAGELEGKR